jgi:hypothetical protein
MEFFRFPHTPHLAWLGTGEPRDDKVLTPDEVESLLSHNVTVEEKIDGANVGFSVDEEGNLQVQNRGSFLTPGNCPPQFKPIWRWLQSRKDALCDSLFPNLMLFGEWCYAVHTVRYSRLPDWFLGFDVFDRSSGAFWSAPRRDELLASLGLAVVPTIGVGSFDFLRLRALLGQSRVGDFLAEGLYVRVDECVQGASQVGWLASRAKLVRPEFVQSIGEHWSQRALEVNKVVLLEV